MNSNKATNGRNVLFAVVGKTASIAHTTASKDNAGGRTSILQMLLRSQSLCSDPVRTDESDQLLTGLTRSPLTTTAQRRIQVFLHGMNCPTKVNCCLTFLPHLHLALLHLLPDLLLHPDRNQRNLPSPLPDVCPTVHHTNEE